MVIFERRAFLAIPQTLFKFVAQALTTSSFSTQNDTIYHYYGSPPIAMVGSIKSREGYGREEHIDDDDLVFAVDREFAPISASFGSHLISHK